ncbi:MAG: signal peptidase I [Firmicutes bacterium]|nr:signal peptidase I [Bacillota bacterium]
MAFNDVQGQAYAPWNPWGQQTPRDYTQALASRYMQQGGWGYQAQPDWNPQPVWDARQPQPAWGAQQPSYGGQYAQAQYPAWTREADGETPADILPAATPEAAPPKRSSRAANLVLNILTICFVVFLIAGSTIFAFSNSETKNLFGYRFYHVLTPSMRPLFKPGDMIFVKLADPSEIKVGDVVTFSPGAKSTAFLTHRVEELLPADGTHPARMVTKGDANNAADPPVNLSAAIGVHVFTIPFIGNVVDMMRTNLALVCVCFGAVFLLLAVLRAYFAARREEKKRKAGAPPAGRPFDIHAF